MLKIIEAGFLLTFGGAFAMAAILYNAPPRGYFLRTFVMWFLVLGAVTFVVTVALHFVGAFR